MKGKPRFNKKRQKKKKQNKKKQNKKVNTQILIIDYKSMT